MIIWSFSHFRYRLTIEFDEEGQMNQIESSGGLN